MAQGIDAGITRREAVLGLVAGATVALSASCSEGVGPSGKPDPIYLAEASASILVEGWEWGPAVRSVVFELPREVTTVSYSGDLRAITNGQRRELAAVYTCGPDGTPADGTAGCIAFEFEVTSEVCGSPFEMGEDGLNHWVGDYRVSLKGDGLSIDGVATPLDLAIDCADKRVCPDTEAFAARTEFAGTYANPSTGADEEVAIQLAAFEPEGLEGAPLLVWLHGGSEGGTDPDIALLGNEVTALAREPIQSHFADAAGNAGAYVLAPQCPTMWMDSGTGSIEEVTSGVAGARSRYEDVLFDAIQAYVAATPAVDPDRVCLLGCSNGGYMTIALALHDPTAWAAIVPVSQAYRYENADGSRHLTDADAAALASLPSWHVVSADDNVVDPTACTNPDYRAIVAAGATNAWLSEFETVRGDEDPDATYYGHWSWVYLFNDQVTAVQEPGGDIVPTNDGGGSRHDVGGPACNVFDWLQAQSR